MRGWDKHWPSRLRGALPQRSWLKRLRRLGLEVLVPLWRHVSTQSPATPAILILSWQVVSGCQAPPQELRWLSSDDQGGSDDEPLKL